MAIKDTENGHMQSSRADVTTTLISENTKLDIPFISANQNSSSRNCKNVQANHVP